eukprot:TRINITY_DN5955_c0_g1_i1.p1 TRINITY_DN5955_c0_g1~~TRINITY_DN5955_c0_g1_i1.p1  ORF type:complete len:763 (-),score=200.77 TRINITY_DN5955_c0_g1_i1:247-2445(-)
MAASGLRVNWSRADSVNFSKGVMPGQIPSEGGKAPSSGSDRPPPITEADAADANMDATTSQRQKKLMLASRSSLSGFSEETRKSGGRLKSGLAGLRKRMADKFSRIMTLKHAKQPEEENVVPFEPSPRSSAERSISGPSRSASASCSSSASLDSQSQQPDSELDIEKERLAKKASVAWRKSEKQCRDMQAAYLKELTHHRELLRKHPDGLPQSEISPLFCDPMLYVDEPIRELVKAIVEERVRSMLAALDSDEGPLGALVAFRIERAVQATADKMAELQAEVFALGQELSSEQLKLQSALVVQKATEERERRACLVIDELKAAAEKLRKQHEKEAQEKLATMLEVERANMAAAAAAFKKQRSFHEDDEDASSSVASCSSSTAPGVNRSDSSGSVLLRVAKKVPQIKIPEWQKALLEEWSLNEDMEKLVDLSSKLWKNGESPEKLRQVCQMLHKMSTISGRLNNAVTADAWAASNKSKAEQKAGIDVLCQRLSGLRSEYQLLVQLASNMLHGFVAIQEQPLASENAVHKACTSCRDLVSSCFNSLQGNFQDLHDAGAWSKCRNKSQDDESMEEKKNGGSGCGGGGDDLQRPLPRLLRQESFRKTVMDRLGGKSPHPTSSPLPQAPDTRVSVNVLDDATTPVGKPTSNTLSPGGAALSPSGFSALSPGGARRAGNGEQDEPLSPDRLGLGRPRSRRPQRDARDAEVPELSKAQAKFFGADFARAKGRSNGPAFS